MFPAEQTVNNVGNYSIVFDNIQFLSWIEPQATLIRFAGFFAADDIIIPNRSFWQSVLYTLIESPHSQGENESVFSLVFTKVTLQQVQHVGDERVVETIWYLVNTRSQKRSNMALIRN